MCDPVSIVLAVVAVVGAVVGKMESDKAANRQEQAIQDGLARDREATAEQYKQIQKTAMDEQAQLHTDYLIDAARIQAIQGESGMQGASHDRVAGEADNNSATDMATLENNRKWQMGAARTQSVAAGSRAQMQLSGVQRKSNLSTGVQIAGGLAGAYASSTAVKANTTATSKPATTKGP